MVLLVSGSSASHMQMRPQEAHEASFLAITVVAGGRDLSTCTHTHAHAYKLVPNGCIDGSKVVNKCVCSRALLQLQVGIKKKKTLLPLRTRRPSKKR